VTSRARAQDADLSQKNAAKGGYTSSVACRDTFPSRGRQGLKQRGIAPQIARQHFPCAVRCKQDKTNDLAYGEKLEFFRCLNNTDLLRKYQKL